LTTVKLEQQNEPIEARPGEEITLEVPGANTTGYLWQLKTDVDAVEVVGHEVIPDHENFGGAGVERFVVRPLRAGDATLHLELKAPWENAPAETLDVRVHSVTEKKTP
jgi:predicted secreted protein